MNNQNCKNFTVLFLGEERTCYLLSNCESPTNSDVQSLSGSSETGTGIYEEFSGSSGSEIAAGAGGCFLCALELSLQVPTVIGICLAKLAIEQENILQCLIETFIGGDCLNCLCTVLAIFKPSWGGSCFCAVDLFVKVGPPMLYCLADHGLSDKIEFGICSVLEYKNFLGASLIETNSLPQTCRNDYFCSSVSSIIEDFAFSLGKPIAGITSLKFPGKSCTCILDRFVTSVIEDVDANLLTKHPITRHRNFNSLVLHVLESLPNDTCPTDVCYGFMGEFVKDYYSPVLAKYSEYCECGFSVSETMNSCSKIHKSNVQDTLVCTLQNLSVDGCKNAVRELLCMHDGDSWYTEACNNYECVTEVVPITANCMIKNAGRIPRAVTCIFEDLPQTCHLPICDVLCDLVGSDIYDLLPNYCLSQQACQPGSTTTALSTFSPRRSKNLLLQNLMKQLMKF